MSFTSATGADMVIDLGDRKYTVPPITLADLGTIEDFIRSKEPTLDEVCMAISHLSAEVQKELFKEELANRRTVRKMDPEMVIQQMQENLEVIAFSLWLSIEKRYPGEIPMNKMLDILYAMYTADPEKFQKMTQQRNAASGLVAENPTTAPEDVPAEATTERPSESQR